MAMAPKLNFKYEWKIPVPWGELVLRRCGKSGGEPVLLIHGRQDSSTVFEPILELMPDTYNYVALDMPGNGLSTPLPTGENFYQYDDFGDTTVLEVAPVAQLPYLEFTRLRPLYHRAVVDGCPKLTRLHFLSAMEVAVNYLGWKKFIFMGHSMGCEQGLFYNTVYPGRITKMILLDAVPTLMRMQIQDLAEFQRTYYDDYYKNYAKENFYRKCRTRPAALTALRRLRDMSEAQAQRLLDRNFHPVTRESERASTAQAQQQQGNDDAIDRIMERIDHLRQTDPEGYLSWDNRLKNLAPTYYGNDYYFELFKSVPPTLLITASDGAKHVPKKWHKGAYELVDRLLKNVENFREIKVEGGHDVHYTHPERVAPYVLKFLDENNNKVCCKL